MRIWLSLTKIWQTRRPKAPLIANGGVRSKRRTILRGDSAQRTEMARKTKKAPPRKAKREAAKPVKRVTRKKAVRRKKTKKPETRLEKFENALLVGAAEMDDLALAMGLLAASRLPRGKKTAKKRRKKR